MKICPTCRRAYADNTLRFCLEDGTVLVDEKAVSTDETFLMDAAASAEPPPTEILDPSLAPTVRAYEMDATAHPRNQAATARQQVRPTVNEFQNVTTSPKQRNTTSVVAITVVATILLLSLGGLGAWLMLKDKSGSATNNGTENTRTGNTSNSTLPSTNTSTNSTTNSTTNTAIVVSTPTATPLASPSATQPQSTPTDTSTARKEVLNALNGWTETMRQADVDRHMAYYADTLHTYYMQSNYSASRVRANVAKAFSKYSTFDVKLTNIQIDVDPSGTSATATFVKTFVFTGETTYSGSGLNKFWFEKIGGRWLITGEKDLK